ncbi:MAG: MopE-related protein [Candidatus Woesearchaeota archaeon]
MKKLSTLLLLVFVLPLALAECIDEDVDGYGAFLDEGCANYPVLDCDDTDEGTYPGAEEICDELDNDCNGVIDEGCGSDVVEDAEEPPGDSSGGSHSGDRRDRGPCEILAPKWLVDGEEAMFTTEGNEVEIIIKGEGCNLWNVNLTLLEFDDMTEEGIIADEVEEYSGNTFRDGEVVIAWESLLMEDEEEMLEDGTFDANPEFLAVAYYYTEDGEAIYNISEYLFSVISAEDVGRYGGMGDDDFRPGAEEDAGSGAYGAEPEQPKISGKRREAEDTCGDGICDDNEECPKDCTASSLWLWILAAVIFLVLAGGGVVYYLKWRKDKKKLEEAVKPKAAQKPIAAKPPLSQKSMVRATAYIKAMRAAGTSDENIKKNFLGHKYTKEQADYAFKNA